VTNYDDTRTSAQRRRIEDLLVRIESEFLATPELKLTVSEAGRRFSADEVTCEAILDALVDAAVLFKTPDRLYGRFFRQLMAA
jgi:hypothetical protein